VAICGLFRHEPCDSLTCPKFSFVVVHKCRLVHWLAADVHRVHIKRCHWFFHNNFYNYARIFMIFGIQLCKWILIILVNLLRCVTCTSLTWWRNVDVTEIMPFTVHVTLSPCCLRETPRGYCSRDVAIRFDRFESGGLQHLGYHLREGLPFADLWCEGVERTSAERVEAAGPHHWQRLRSGVVVWMHVFAWMVDILNINFERLTFCCNLFVSSILVPLNVIDINMCKVLILCEMCYFCLRLLHGMIAT